MNKYSNLIDRSVNDDPNVSEQYYGSSFWKSESRSDFEVTLDEHLDKKPKRRKRLGDGNSIGAALEPSDDLVPLWTGTIYMGRFTPMDVAFDTGSDWLVIESHLCKNCEGNTYDTSDSE